MFYVILMISFLFAGQYQTRVLENSLLKISIDRKERLEAEPASQPYEIVVKVDCKKSKNVREAQFNFPVCDFDPNDKDTVMNDTYIKIAHYAWDAVKSSNNPEGRVYCDSKKKLYHEVQFSEICQNSVKAKPVKKK